MPNEISSKTREQLEALCRQISVSRNLDDDIRKELFGHMEDRLLAHMSGEQALTEQEAFILVREHFGDAGAVKEEYQRVYAVETTANVGRLMAAAMTTYFSMYVAQIALQCGIALFAGLAGTWRNPIQLALFAALALGLIPWGFYRVLRRWRTLADRGDPVWFQTASTGKIVSICAIIVGVNVAVTKPFALGLTWSFHDDFALTFFFGLLTLIGSLIKGVIWMWFCDQSPHTRASAKAAVTAWGLTFFLLCVSRSSISGTNASQISRDLTLWEMSPLLFLGVFIVLLWGYVFASLSFGLYRLVENRLHRDRDDAPLQWD